MTTTHLNYCKLDPNHYGPCSADEHEYFVTNPQGAVVWRQALPPDPPYSDAPDSDYQRVYKPARDAARQACLDAAFRLGGLPSIRHHARFTDSVDWPIECREITERGDLALTLPVGVFRLEARRENGTDSPPVKIHGRVSRNVSLNGGAPYWFQPASVEYADGTRSGFLGSYPRDIFPLEDETR